ncbi:hypothetical protein QWY82_05170 [Simiduia curdlanivorans]|uniref:DUF748 domain-containing protein n=1 Tax=Simiduia curdlanivorans TaxID=1492769 RepID=A0ABV8V3S5_9GAMM|nr:hypothetical protein [Simiduia curdlanivorans]MDN3638200.1 hypothetical protein [Simiduia curdlanivorans]
MGKKLFKLILLLALVAVAGRWLLQWEIRNSVDASIADMRDTVSIRYDRLDVGFDGKVTVKRVQLSLPDSDAFSASIQRIDVDMQSLPELVQRRFGGSAPEALSVKVTGINANLENFAESIESSVDCLDPLKQPSPWMLGFQADSDLNFSYLYNAATRDLTLDVDMIARGAYELKTQVRFGGVAPNLKAASSLDLVRVNFDDIRMMQAWTSYCSARHEKSAEQLVTGYMANLEALLNKQSLGLSEASQAALKSYMQEPGRIVLRWVLNIDLQEPPSADAISDMLFNRLEVEVAGAPVSPIFTSVEYKPVAPRPQLQPKIVAKAPALVEIDFEQLQDYVDKEVQLVTGDKITTGVVRKVGGAEIELEVIKDGANHFSITFYRSRIDQILVKP